MSDKEILTSSDHHANWPALEKLFTYAKEHKLPFVINGDIIGDYNFEDLAQQLNLKFPYEITEEKLKKKLGKELFAHYITYQQIRNSGKNIDHIIRQYPDHLKEQAINNLKKIISYIESDQFQNKLKHTHEDIEKQTRHIISNHKIKLRALYNIIVKTHAKKLADLIDTYKVNTIFLNGNHEPSYFPVMVKSHLKNKDLFTNLDSVKGILTINSINIAGVSNVNALMPYLNHIYSKEELDSAFSHQRTKRPIIFRNLNEDTLKTSKEHKKDPDWIRIMQNGPKEIDIFFTHGQIGQGAWSDQRKANEMPTLHVAAMLSYIAQLTIDGHLHTTHEMTNPLSKKTIRAVGNTAFRIKKENNKITYEKVQVDAPYNHRNGMSFENTDLNTLIMDNIWGKD